MCIRDRLVTAHNDPKAGDVVAMLVGDENAVDRVNQIFGKRNLLQSRYEAPAIDAQIHKHTAIRTGKKRGVATRTGSQSTAGKSTHRSPDRPDACSPNFLNIRSDGMQFINKVLVTTLNRICLLYTSPSPRDVEESRMPSSA